MADEALEWSTDMLSDAQGRIEARRRANLDQLILVQGRHRGLIEALAALRERHAQVTRADADTAAVAAAGPEGAGLAAASRLVHELAVSTHAEVLAQSGSVRENEALVEALVAMGQQATERQAARAKAEADEVARAQAEAEGQAQAAPGAPAEAKAEPSDFEATELPAGTLVGPSKGMLRGSVEHRCGDRQLRGLTVAQAIAAEERRCGLTSLAHMLGPK